MRTRRSHPIHRRSPRRGLAGRRLRRHLALAAVAAFALVMTCALGALAADSDSLKPLGITVGPAPPPGGPPPGTHHILGQTVAQRSAPRVSSAPGPRALIPQAVIAATPGGSLLDVPPAFLGISTEYWALPQFERQMSVFERTLSLLRAPGQGPLVLRIGGDSADHSFWVPKARPLPPWAFELTPAWLQRTSELVRALSLRLIIDLNLVTTSPGAAARWAQAAAEEMPPGSIQSFEIGNEPDIYNREFWMATVAHSKVVPPIGLTAESYARDFQDYARALRHVAAGIPLVGPALANPNLSRDWITTLLAGRPARPAEITIHRYPYSACSLPGTSTFATIGRVLSEHASAAMAQTVKPAVALARRAGVPVRLTEMNSVTCGGRRGVSDSFATALWAPDALFELVRAGVDGASIHVRASTINSAFTLTPRGLYAKPLLYGLIAFTKTLGPGAQLVPLNVGASPATHLKVWGVRIKGGALRVLLIDKGAQPVHVSLRLPATGPATVERLIAPSPSARSEVTFAGEYLTTYGTWSGRGMRERVDPGRYGYSVLVPRYSAAIVTLRLRPGAFTSWPVRSRARRATRPAGRRRPAQTPRRASRRPARARHSGRRS